MSDLITYFEDQKQATIDQLIELVQRESFSSDKATVDQIAVYLQQQFEALGAEAIERYPQDEVGDMFLAKWQADAPGKPVLFMAHMDTVHPTGTLEDFPVSQDDEGRLFGPGAIDMKAGIAVMMTAIKGLQERDEMPQRPIWVLMTSDEEIGSKRSKSIIEDVAQHAGLVLVMEPATNDGAIKTWRKGVASYTMQITGRAAHAGNAPESGLNSIIEFAQHALDLNKLNDLKYGTSVSVTMVNGGTASNVIPAQTTAQIDTRTMTVQAFEKLDAAIKERLPFMPGTEIEVVRGHYRPPMERAADVVDKVKAIADQNGITVREDGVGGGSDGNFTAAMGIPTVDGLGPQGGGLHTLEEFVLVNTIPARVALVAALVRDWS